MYVRTYILYWLARYIFQMHRIVALYMHDYAGKGWIGLLRVTLDRFRDPEQTDPAFTCIVMYVQCNDMVHLKIYIVHKFSSGKHEKFVAPSR